MASAYFCADARQTTRSSITEVTTPPRAVENRISWALGQKLMDMAGIARQRTGQASAPAAIYRAARLRLRLRPILMTTLAAIFGAMPLALGTGDGAEMRQPLGIAIVGGLILSQLLTLYTTPLVYVLMDRLKSKRLRPVAAPVTIVGEPA